MEKPYPQATKFPEGAYAQAIIQVVGIVTVCSLFVVNASQIINFPSWLDDTICRLSGDQSEHKTLAVCPFKTRLGLMLMNVIISMRSAAAETVYNQNISNFTNENMKINEMKIRTSNIV